MSLQKKKILSKYAIMSEILVGVEHDSIPEDMKRALEGNLEVLERWNALTPLARNEWICWITIVKKVETRENHIVRLGEDLLKGKKRPCCWPGCPHHNPKAARFFT